MYLLFHQPSGNKKIWIQGKQFFKGTFMSLASICRHFSKGYKTTSLQHAVYDGEFYLYQILYTSDSLGMWIIIEAKALNHATLTSYKHQ